MLKPFDLPEGVTWRDLTDDDRRWLASTSKADSEKCAAIHIHITLRHPDGRTRICIEDWYPFLVERETVDGLREHIKYQWSDGNFGCDCNRARFFARAGNEPEPESGCGDAYRIVAPAWLAEDHASSTAPKRRSR